MQDEINEKVIALSIRTTKLTAEMLQKSIRFMLSQIKKQLDTVCEAQKSAGQRQARAVQPDFGGILGRGCSSST